MGSRPGQPWTTKSVSGHRLGVPTPIQARESLRRCASTSAQVRLPVARTEHDAGRVERKLVAGQFGNSDRDRVLDATDMSLMMQGAQPRNTTSAKKPVVDGGVMAP